MTDISELKGRLLEVGIGSLEYRAHLVICALERGGVLLSESAGLAVVKEELLSRTGEGDQLASRALSVIRKLERDCCEEEVDRELEEEELDPVLEAEEDEDYSDMEDADFEEDDEEDDELDDLESFRPS